MKYFAFFACTFFCVFSVKTITLGCRLGLQQRAEQNPSTALHPGQLVAVPVKSKYGVKYYQAAQILSRCKVCWGKEEDRTPLYSYELLLEKTKDGRDVRWMMQNKIYQITE